MLKGFWAILVVFCAANTWAQSASQEADTAYKEKRYADAARLYGKAYAVSRGNPSLLYNAACSHALNNDVEKAFVILGMAVRGEFSDASLMEKDTDLAGLHNDPRWAKLVERVRENAKVRHSRLSDPLKSPIVTEDLARFFVAFDKAMAAPADAREGIVQREYLDKGTPGLRDYVSLKVGGAKELAAAMGKYPRFYESLRGKIGLIAPLTPQIRAALIKMQGLIENAEFPAVYFVIGVGTSGGTVSNNGLLLGAEQLLPDTQTPVDELPSWFRDLIAHNTTAEKRLPPLIAHELTHFQQHYGDRSTLLGYTISEGSADFVAQLATGTNANPQLTAYGDANEATLWAEFQKEMGGTDSSRWIANMRTVQGRPADLGYYLGRRICESYYAYAKDKKQAVKDMLLCQDFPKFLRDSRYGKKFAPATSATAGAKP